MGVQTNLSQYGNIGTKSLFDIDDCDNICDKLTDSQLQQQHQQLLYYGGLSADPTINVANLWNDTK